MPLKVSIIDYDMGNLFNLAKVLRYLGAQVSISQEAEDIMKAQRLILPGVGAFGDGMKRLSQRNLIKPIKEFVSSGRPLLGICLGMQLFMSGSEEFGYHQGLNLIKGVVRRFPQPAKEEPFYKIPHVGWNSLLVPFSKKDNGKWQGSLLGALKEGDFVYFVHSYIVIPEETAIILAETEYAGVRFCSAMNQGNMLGCQFHPEISGEIGLMIMKTFLTLN